MIHYIQKDKMTKRETGMAEEEIKESVKFVDHYINGDGVGSKLLRYCNKKDGLLGMPVKHYLDNKITKSFMVFLMWYGFYSPSEDELNKMPYVTAHYRDVAANFNKDTIKLCERII